MSHMTVGGTSKAARLSRRATMLAPLALAGCDMVDNWLAPKKDPLPGKREVLAAPRRGFAPDETAPKVSLPAAVTNPDWPQAGGNPTHLMGHLNAGEVLKQVWASNIGEGGGYRRKILAQPVVADGMVFAMDSDSVVTAFSLNTGARLWRTPTVDRDLESSNVGGGLCWDSGTLYAVNGVTEVLAMEAAKGAIRWRHSLDVSARSAPTFADGRIFVTTIDSRLLALSPDDGHLLWSYQATQTSTSVLGSPAPAFAQGIVVAGFGSGEIAALRAATGAIIWTDALGVVEGRPTIVDFQAIRGAPVISNGLLYVTGLGGVTIAADLLSGRRAWERRVASANTPWIAGDWMFMITTDQDVGAINANDARIAWVAQLPRWENPEKKKDTITWYGPVVAGGRLILLGGNSKMLSINPLTGETLNTQTLSDVPASFAPIVADGTILVVTEDGKLTAWK
jgi:outer membrane protein assembly factor BamB